MKKIIYILLALCPSFIHVRIRRMMGQKIGKGSKLKIGTLIFSNKLNIGSGTIIGPFTMLNTQELTIGDNGIIKPLTFITTRVVELDDYVHIAPFCIISSEFTVNSYLKIGDHTRVFPFCWLDTGEGISIGKQVGVGTYTLMYTHGVWSNHIDGGPVSFGPIVIKDNVWLTPKIFILPNVTIGENVIVGANSLINKSVEANSLIGGSPAKVIKKIELDKSRKKERFVNILKDYSEHLDYTNNLKSELKDNQLIFINSKIVIDDTDNLNKNDLLILVDKDFNTSKPLLKNGMSILDYKQLTIFLNGNKREEVTLFISFLRRYGVRLYIDKTKH